MMSCYDVNTMHIDATAARFDSRPVPPSPAWADQKWHGYEEMLSDAIVEVKDPTRLSLPERNALLKRIRKLNFVIYHCGSVPMTKLGVKSLAIQFGLNRLDRNPCADADAISSVRVSTQGPKHRYIPYTDRSLGWHTDGYYNGSDNLIRSFILHCVTPAPTGGVNSFLDPEIVYLLLGEEGDQHLAALSEPDAFSIPPDRNSGDDSRNHGFGPHRTGPVFSNDPVSRALHMRYTARKHNIQWSAKPATREALKHLRVIIDGAGRYTATHRLEHGQGVICNNVLHKRSGFVDGATDAQQRLIYRARYHDRVLGTDPAW